MNPRRFLVALSTVILTATGCNRPPNLDVQTFNLEHRSGYEAADLIDPYIFGDRVAAPGGMSATPNAITIRETRDNLEKIARVLEEFDQPIPGLRLRFQLIEADSFEEEDPSISDITQELRSLFRFEGYRLLGEAVVAVAGGTHEAQAFSRRILGWGDETFEVEASVRLLPAGGVRLDPVQLIDFTNTQLLASTVNVTPGQTLVIGGTHSLWSPEGRRSSARTLVLTVRAEKE